MSKHGSDGTAVALSLLAYLGDRRIELAKAKEEIIKMEERARYSPLGPEDEKILSSKKANELTTKEIDDLSAVVNKTFPGEFRRRAAKNVSSSLTSAKLDGLLGCVGAIRKSGLAIQNTTNLVAEAINAVCDTVTNTTLMLRVAGQEDEDEPPHKKMKI